MPWRTDLAPTFKKYQVKISNSPQNLHFELSALVKHTEIGLFSGLNIDIDFTHLVLSCKLVWNVFYSLRAF